MVSRLQQQVSDHCRDLDVKCQGQLYLKSALNSLLRELLIQFLTEGVHIGVHI